MEKCSLCETELDEENNRCNHFDSHWDEVKSVGAKYCPKCWEILAEKTKIGGRKYIRKIKIKKSYYPLPGFILSEDKKHYVRGKKE